MGPAFRYFGSFAALAIATCGAIAQDATPSASYKELRLPNHHWSIAIPAGWSVAPGDLVDAVNNEVSSRMPTQNVRYVAAIVPDAKNGPYVLIQTLSLPEGGATYEQIEKNFNAASLGQTAESVKKNMGDLMTDFTIDRAVLDRERNQIAMSNSITGPNGEVLRNASVGMLGSESVVMIHFYAADGVFAARLPEFRAIVDGFRHDSGHEFVPASSAGNGMWSNAMRQGMIGGIAVALAGGVIYLTRKFKRAA